MKQRCDYLLHLQERSRVSAGARRKQHNRTCDMADHVGREPGPRESNECHRAPANRANGSDEFENLIKSKGPLLQVRSLHHAQQRKAAPRKHARWAATKDREFDAGDLEMAC